jgi:acetyl esterase/lipase
MKLSEMKSIGRLAMACIVLWSAPLRAETPAAKDAGGAPAAVKKESTTRPKSLPAGATMEADLKYGSVSGRGQLLDLYLPAKIDKPLPLIVWIHGGGWSGGDKANPPGLAMLSRGYAVASLNYRLTKEAIYPAQIHDCKGAIRWLRAHAEQYHLDPKHIGVWGASAGGHLVALIGTSGEVAELEGDVGGNLDQSSRVQCVVDWFGPTDMSVFFDQAAAGPNIFKAKPDHSPLSDLFGGPLKEHLNLVRLGNPITFVKKDNPPFLIVHGDQDTLVPLAQSQILYDALKKAEVDVHLEVLEGAGHGNGFDKQSLREMMASFFDKHLKPAK